MGVTALWLSPVLKQVSFRATYHGYAIQNFLAIDPHFGTTEDLQSLVKSAHDNGMYVMLDIILNHAGDVFGYAPDRYRTDDGHGHQYLDARWDGRPYSVAGFRDRPPPSQTGGEGGDWLN